jgi:hypothetical protein
MVSKKQKKTIFFVGILKATEEKEQNQDPLSSYGDPDQCQSHPGSEQRVVPASVYATPASSANHLNYLVQQFLYCM